jgi:hypothetical protein
MKLERVGPNRKLIGWRRHAGLITCQEYVPFTAWVLAWAAMTAAVGLSTAMSLMAANAFVQATRSLFLTQSFDAISARHDCAPDLRARARRLALRVDIVVLLGSIALLIPLAAGMLALGLTELATMMLVIALGLPARTPAVLALSRRTIGTAWRMGSALTLLGGGGLVALFDLHWAWAALALGMREWGGFIAASFVGGSRPATTTASISHLGFSEIASRTSLAARRRLVYRIGKVVLSVLGPIGSILARTGRGGGLDRRLAQSLSLNPVYVGLLAVACSAAAVVTVVMNREPPALLIASVVARVAAASFSVLIWWRWNAITEDFEWLNEDL